MESNLSEQITEMPIPNSGSDVESKLMQEQKSGNGMESDLNEHLIETALPNSGTCSNVESKLIQEQKPSSEMESDLNEHLTETALPNNGTCSNVESKLIQEQKSSSEMESDLNEHLIETALPNNGSDVESKLIQEQKSSSEMESDLSEHLTETALPNSGSDVESKLIQEQKSGSEMESNLSEHVTETVLTNSGSDVESKLIQEQNSGNEMESNLSEHITETVLPNSGRNVETKLVQERKSGKRRLQDYNDAWRREKDPDVAKLRQLACGVKQKKKKIPKVRIESSASALKIRVEFTTHKRNALFVCNLFIHGILVASKEGKKLKEARQNAYSSALQRLLMPHLRVVASNAHAKSLEASMKPFPSRRQTKSENPSVKSGLKAAEQESQLNKIKSGGKTSEQESELNKESNIAKLKERGKGFKPIDKFVILEPKNLPTRKNIDATLRRSANINEMLLEHEYFFNSDNVRCVLRLENNILADVTESSKVSARTAASAVALQKLQESCWTIKTKRTGPLRDTICLTNVVTRNKLRQGISEGNTEEFCRRVREVIKKYVNSHIEASLAFTCDFSVGEKKAIRREVSKVGLHADLASKYGKKYYCVWRPYGMLFAFLKSVGGVTKQYRLVPPKGDVFFNFKSTPDASCSSSSQPNQFVQQTGNKLISAGMTGASVTSNVGVNKQPVHEQGMSRDSQQEQGQKGIASQGASSQATSSFSRQPAKDWPPKRSDVWQTGRPDMWTQEDPSTSSSHQQGRETHHPQIAQHPRPSAGHESRANETEGGEEYTGNGEILPLKVLRKFILLKKAAIKTDRQFLQDTAHFNKSFIQFKYDKPDSLRPSDASYQIMCHVLLGRKVVASSSAPRRGSARTNACRATVEKMKRFCWLIEVKQPKEDTEVVGRSVFCRGNLNESRKTFSDTLSQAIDKTKVTNFVETLLRSSNTRGFVFNDEFSNQEARRIQSICGKVNVQFNPFRTKTRQFYSMCRNWTPKSLLKHLQVLGGESDNHKLFPPLGENADPSLATTSTTFKPFTPGNPEVKGPYDATGQSANVVGYAEQSPFMQVSHVNYSMGAENVGYAGQSPFVQASHVNYSMGVKNVGYAGQSPFVQASNVNYSMGTENVGYAGQSPFVQASHVNYSMGVGNVGYAGQSPSFMQVSHVNYPMGTGECSSLPRIYPYNPRNFQAGSLWEGSHPYNARNFEGGSMKDDNQCYDLKIDHNAGENSIVNPRMIPQDLGESGQVTLGNMDFGCQGSSQGERFGHMPRNNDDDYHGSNRRESHSYRHRSTDDHYHGGNSEDEDHGRKTDDDYQSSSREESRSYRHRNANNDYQGRNTVDDYHGSSWGESVNYRNRNADYNYRDLSPGKSDSYRYRSSDEDYYGSHRGESDSFRHRDSPDEYHGSHHGESDSFRHRDSADDYRGSHHGKSDSFRHRDSEDDYPGSHRGESDSFRHIDSDDDYRGSHHGESDSFRHRNSDDDYRGSHRGESDSFRHRDSDDNYHGSHRGESDSFRYRDSDDNYRGSHRGERDGYRHRNADDNYRGSHPTESDNFRHRNNDDDYHGSHRAERGSRRTEIDSFRHRNRDDDYRSSRRGASHSHKSRHDTLPRSRHLEKGRHEERRTWRVGNSPPSKLRRVQ